MGESAARATLLAFLGAVRNDTPLGPHLAADATFTARTTGQVVRGRDAVAAFIRSFYRGAFDARGNVAAAVFLPDGRLMLTLDLVGWHIGTFMDIPATGRLIRVRCALVCEARDGAVVAIIGRMPVDQLLAQLLAPPVAKGVG